MQGHHIRWGIIGCGNVTEVKSGPGFQKASHSSLQAVMRRNSVAAADYAERHGVPSWYDRAEDLIHDPDVDAVYVATPPSSHAELASLVAKARKPCYVEKPMACTVQECESMISTFHKAATPLFVAYYRRALPQFQTIQQMIQEKSFGPLIRIDYSFTNGSMRDPSKSQGWRLNKDISGGGILWDLGSHALDLLDWWAGPLHQIEGQRVCHDPASGIEHQANLKAQTESGVEVSAQWDFTREDKTDEMRFTFESAEVMCSAFGSPEIEIYTSSDSLKESFDVPAHVQQPLIQNVVDSLRGQSIPLSTGESAFRTNQVLEALPLVSVL